MSSHVCRDALQVADHDAGVIIIPGRPILRYVHLMGSTHDLVRYIDEGNDGRSQADCLHCVHADGGAD